jgi:hypothetical protein
MLYEGLVFYTQIYDFIKNLYFVNPCILCYLIVPIALLMFEGCVCLAVHTDVASK